MERTTSPDLERGIELAIGALLDARGALARGDRAAAAANAGRARRALEGCDLAPAGDGAAAPLRIRCLGRFEVAIDGTPVTHWPRRKAQLVLAALVLHRDGLTSGQVADLLGDHVTPTILKVAVLNLRRTLEPTLERGEDSRWIRQHDGRYVLAPEAIAASDMAAFDAALEAGDLRGALAHVRGNLLEEPFFEGYFEAEREHFQRRAQAALWQLADESADEDAEAALKRAIELAPTDERGYIRLMRFYQHRGRALMARKCYWDCRKALRRQLGLETSEQIDAAMRELGID